METLTANEARGHLFLTVQEKVARQSMTPPRPVNAASVQVASAPYDYLYVSDLHFVRPVYLQVLAVLLTLLVTAAAAYAVFMRPLAELVVKSGALVLGVWASARVSVQARLQAGACVTGVSAVYHGLLHGPPRPCRRKFRRRPRTPARG